MYHSISKLIFDFKYTQLISTIGLRIILSAKKKMNTQSIMIVKIVADDAMEVFNINRIHGFLEI
ncbi:MAG: hypothetical protein HUJ51_04065 [Eggerthellaceae bacterium]|nr:hypothetical protein [Eggerthellaceae bacterium]